MHTGRQPRPDDEPWSGRRDRYLGDCGRRGCGETTVINMIYSIIHTIKIGRYPYRGGDETAVTAVPVTNRQCGAQGTIGRHRPSPGVAAPGGSGQMQFEPFQGQHQILPIYLYMDSPYCIWKLVWRPGACDGGRGLRSYNYTPPVVELPGTHWGGGLNLPPMARRLAAPGGTQMPPDMSTGHRRTTGQTTGQVLIYGCPWRPRHARTERSPMFRWRLFCIPGHVDLHAELSNKQKTYIYIYTNFR